MQSFCLLHKHRKRLSKHFVHFAKKYLPENDCKMLNVASIFYFWEKPILLLVQSLLFFFFNRHDRDAIDRHLKITFMPNFKIDDSLLFISCSSVNVSLYIKTILNPLTLSLAGTRIFFFPERWQIFPSMLDKLIFTLRVARSPDEK